MFKIIKRYVSDGYSDFGSYTVEDHDIANVLRKHLRFRDRLNLDKIVEAAAYAHALMADNEHKGKDPFEADYKFEFYGNKVDSTVPPYKAK